MSTLGAELSLITAYLDIERARFEERLSVDIDVPFALHSAAIPPLLIEPLVENAIKHGIAPFQRPGRLVLRARLDPMASHSTALLITVQDSGPGLREIENEMHASLGVGLRNIEERLEHVYGDAGTLRLTSSPGSGTTAELRIPYVPFCDGPQRCEADAHMTERMRVIVADDERPARSYLMSMLRRRPDVDLVGEAETGVEAVALIERERPDLAFSISRCRKWTALASFEYSNAK